MRRFTTILLAWAVCGQAAGDEAVWRGDNVVVRYDGIDEPYAKAIARTVQLARAAAVEQFGFDMPKTVFVSVRVDPRGRVRLFNDGQDRFSLTVRGRRDLRKPAVSGVFHLYGLCHEVAHLAMYRPIRDHSWMTVAAAEGWAHYLGSRLVDAVYAKAGKDLWPDAYDYLADGMRRLKAQLAGASQSKVVRGAGLWRELAALIGDKKLAPLLKAWGELKIDPADPAAALRKALLAVHKDLRLAAWWNKAEPLLVVRRPKSGFAARTARAGDLTGKPVELAADDGKPAGRRSIAGSGHAVRQAAGAPDLYLTAVKVYGARYGRRRPPEESFHVWLCDRDFKAIADFPFPYATFPYGRPRWVTLTVKPTNVPREFIVCVGFNPTATKGVFVYYDAAGSRRSLTGLPGRGGRKFDRGDWLLRVCVDQLKSADALKPAR